MAKKTKAGLTGPQRAKVKKVAKFAAEILELIEDLDDDDDEAGEPDPPDDETPAERRKRLRAEKKSGAKNEDDDPTLDDVREILTKVIEEFDNKEAEVLLKDFKAKRASDLAEKDYAKFIAACQEALDED
jgi:hypothetical protein